MRDLLLHLAPRSSPFIQQPCRSCWRWNLVRKMITSRHTQRRLGQWGGKVTRGGPFYQRRYTYVSSFPLSSIRLWAAYQGTGPVRVEHTTTHRGNECANGGGEKNRIQLKIFFPQGEKKSFVNMKLFSAALPL